MGFNSGFKGLICLRQLCWNVRAHELRDWCQHRMYI